MNITEKTKGIAEVSGQPAIVTINCYGGTSGMFNITGTPSVGDQSLDYNASADAVAGKLALLTGSTWTITSGSSVDAGDVVCQSQDNIQLDSIGVSFSNVTDANPTATLSQSGIAYGAPVNEVQSIILTTGADSGAYFITFNSQTTAFRWNAGYADVSDALNALSSISPNGVSVTAQSYGFDVTFENALGAADLDLLGWYDSTVDLDNYYLVAGVVFPTEANVAAGIPYGPTGSEFTGSYPLTATSKAEQLADDQAAVAAGTASILFGTTILDQAGALPLASVLVSAGGSFDEAARNTDPGQANVWTGTSYKIGNVSKTGSKVASSITNCIAGNIKNGVTIGDVTGNYTATGGTGMSQLVFGLGMD